MPKIFGIAGTPVVPGVFHLNPIPKFCQCFQNAMSHVENLLSALHTPTTA